MIIHNNSLTQNSVSIQSTEYGMRAYVNSTRGRVQLEAEVPDYLVVDIYKVWGDTPTVTEPVYDIPIVSPQPTGQEKFNASVMVQLAKMKAGVK